VNARRRLRHRPLAGLAAAALLVAPGLVAARDARPADDEIVLEGGSDGLGMRRLVEQASEITGEPFFFDPGDLGGRVPCLGSFRVARSRFLSIFDALLRSVDFVRLERTIGSQKFHLVRRLGQQARGQISLKTLARIVTREELARIADRDELVTTDWTPRHVPERGFIDSVCVYFTDSSTQSVRNIDTTGTLVMTGFARDLASRIEMMERVDAEVGASGRRLKSPTAGLARRIAALEREMAARLLESPPAGVR
jgi:hypothetical protein